MTKRAMTKKFMRETGSDKKTAMDFLRKCQWDYGYAKALYLAPQALDDLSKSIANIDWSAILKSVADAVNAMTECIAEIVNSDEFHDACMAALEEKKKSEPRKKETVENSKDEKKTWANKLIPVGFSEHDCESHYKCPFCGEPYRSWSMTIGKVFKCKCGHDVWTD